MMETQQSVECAVCHTLLTQPPEDLPICDSCRAAARARPLPYWVRGATVVVACAVILSLTQFGKALKVGIAYERGQRAEARGDYRAAEAQYRIVVDRFPHSTKALVRLAVSSYRAEDLKTTVEMLDRLEGKEADEDQLQEVNAIVGDLEQRAQRVRREERP